MYAGSVQEDAAVRLRARIFRRLRKYLHLHLGSILLLALAEAVGEVLEEAALDDGVQAGEAAHLAGALAEAGAKLAHDSGVGGGGDGGLLALQVLQVFDRHLEDVGLLQLGMSGGLQQRDRAAR